MKIAAIILAAGASTRMSKHKQFLTFKKTPFLKLLYDQLSTLPLHSITCVTGELHKELIHLLKGKNLSFIRNKDYKKGMLSSIQVGLNKVLDCSKPDAILICLTDQPLIQTNHYQKIIELAIDSSKNIISSSFNETFGPPILIKSTYFEEMLQLQAKSAKPFIKAHEEDVEFIPCEYAGVDIDTDEDYKQLIESYE